jgi:hypothetical protein
MILALELRNSQTLRLSGAVLSTDDGFEYAGHTYMTGSENIPDED